MRFSANKMNHKYDSSPRHLISMFWKVMVMSNQDFYEIIIIEQNKGFFCTVLLKSLIVSFWLTLKYYGTLKLQTHSLVFNMFSVASTSNLTVGTPGDFDKDVSAT